MMILIETFLHGVEHGFMIVDRENVDKCIETNNHSYRL